MLTIGILSDTHGRLPVAAYNELADCDRIIHAGDIGYGILEELATLAPVTAVLGNNDAPGQYPGVNRFALERFEGVGFLVVHTPDDLQNALRGGTSVLAPGDALPQVAVHGHTHVPKLVSDRGALPAGWLICPGSVSRPRGGSGPSVAKVTVKDGRVMRAWLAEL